MSPHDALPVGWTVEPVAPDSAESIPVWVQLRYDAPDGSMDLAFVFAPHEARALAVHLLAEADLAEQTEGEGR